MIDESIFHYYDKLKYFLDKKKSTIGQWLAASVEV
jgi:hypothetical protein